MGDERPDRPVFCGNFEYDAEEKDIVKLFEKYGPVEKIDMKTGFAFLYMRYKSDGDYAISKLDRTEYGYKRRLLRVEWAQQKEADRKRDTRPSASLFVVNFDPRRTRDRDIERHFERYGPLKRVEIKKNYAFVQFPDVESAIRAMDRTNGSVLDGRTLTVEYVQNDDPNSAPVREPRFAGRDRRGSPSPVRDRHRSPPARRDDRRDRSRSPVRRRSPSRSPPPPRREERSPPRRNDRSRSPPPRRDRSRSPEARKPDRSPSYDR